MELPPHEAMATPGVNEIAELNFSSCLVQRFAELLRLLASDRAVLKALVDTAALIIKPAY
jgi:hypothetical protein